MLMIDIHSHILPGLDDGPQTWEEALEMARLAAEDGIQIMVATPHLFKDRFSDVGGINNKETILAQIHQFREKLSQAQIPLEIMPGCDMHLSPRALELLEEDQVFTINDTRNYLLLELPDMSFPPGIGDVCFNLQSKGITPIITHPERHFLIQEMPDKLRNLLDLGCLAQITATSVLGGFGRAIARFSRDLLKKGYVQVAASDAHDTRGRAPKLRRAVEEIARVIGKKRAWDMVTTIPDKIIKGQPVN
ncbi:MAG: capsular biosynthesis protein [Deltaproteobacteria bacterium]|nr:capsular biosynthesis protein [Deltaproteobacteria bacterium]